VCFEASHEIAGLGIPKQHQIIVIAGGEMLSVRRDDHLAARSLRSEAKLCADLATRVSTLASPRVPPIPLPVPSTKRLSRQASRTHIARQQEVLPVDLNAVTREIDRSLIAGLLAIEEKLPLALEIEPSDVPS
jgi:hypothetical protein